MYFDDSSRVPRLVDQSTPPYDFFLFFLKSTWPSQRAGMRTQWFGSEPFIRSSDPRIVLLSLFLLLKLLVCSHLSNRFCLVEVESPIFNIPLSLNKIFFFRHNAWKTRTIIKVKLLIVKIKMKVTAEGKKVDEDARRQFSKVAVSLTFTALIIYHTH